MKRLLASADQWEEGSRASLPSLLYLLAHYYLHPRRSLQGWVAHTMSTMQRSESPGPVSSSLWSSFAANGDRIAVFSPACVVNFGAPIELGTNVVNLRSDGQGDTIATLTAKTVPIPIGPSGFGLAIAGAVIYDPGHQTGNGFIVNVPVSFDFSKSVRININFGAQYNDGDPRGLFATGGVGVSWNFVPQWSVISEVFAIMGPGQSNPRVQSGLRYSPTKDIDWDLIYGRNLTGEGANWITVALTIRIGEN